MEKQYVVLYTSYNSAYPKPTNLTPTTRWNFQAPNKPTFSSVEAALEAVKTIVPVQGFHYCFDIVELIAAVETKPVIETTVTRY